MGTSRITSEWLAGFFDGEGCICLQMCHGYVRLRVNITQADEELLAAIRDKFGANYLYAKPRKNSDSLVYEIGWYGSSCRSILRVLDGHVVKKQAQVTLALQYLDTIVGSGNKLSNEVRKDRESMRQQMRELNYVGPFKPHSLLISQPTDTKGLIQ